ncbi:MAG: cobalamin-dependent protein [Candidatus Aenigmarchaeota archaeon]|nr:cobalamin-dependent protein [Candidatus Aenigmarchaeota archaeon]
MKVMLIQPPGNYLIKPSGERGGKLAVHPIGIAYIAAVLEKNGYEVKILDALVEGYENEEPVRDCHSGKIIRYGLSYKEIKYRIQEFNPDVVGISCLQSTRHIEAHKVCSIAKEVNPNIIVLIGGGHPTALPKTTLKDKNIDYVVIGEGEHTTLELLKALENKNSLKEINGIGYKENEKIIIQPKIKWIENLNELPMPTWHLLPMEKYMEIGMSPGRMLKNRRWVTMYTSRGCPNSCSYCPANKVWGNRFRWRSPESIITEMEFLIKEYGIKEFQFEDSNMTVDKKRMMKFCDEIIKRNLDISWSMPHGTAIGTLDEELLRKMKDSGCYALYLAIESAEQEILNSVSKPLKITEVRPVIEMCKKIGFHLIGYFMLGFPGETMKNINNTIDFAESLDLDGVSFFISTPLPGTVFYRECKEKGYLRKGFKFEDARYGVGNIVTEEFDPEIIEKIRRDAWLRIMKKRVDTNGYDKSKSGFERSDVQ